jgi:ribose/xylose/arabinose/galactoside ABC-type transport system permease subunit
VNTLVARGRIAVPAIPCLGMLITPFLPFTTSPTLWFGVPAPIVWVVAMIVLLVVALRIVEASYRRAVGPQREAAR